MLIASFVVCLNPDDTSRHFRFPFLLSESAEKLEIVYKYSPKRCFDPRLTGLVRSAYQKSGEIPPSDETILKEGLSNLITLSVDSPEGLVGTAHRHLSDSRYFIGKTEASPGFSPTAINAGEWTAVLSAHAVMSEKVEVIIQVFAE